MKSNIEILVEATGIDSEIVSIVYARNKAKFNGHIANYRHYKREGKSLENISKKILEALYYQSYSIVSSRRNQNSEIVVPLTVLNSDGLQNFRIVSYLLSSHFFLSSQALALIGGFVNGPTAMSVISSKFRNKVNFLNSISAKDSSARLKAFLDAGVDKFRTERRDIKEILSGIEFDSYKVG